MSFNLSPTMKRGGWEVHVGSTFAHKVRGKLLNFPTLIMFPCSNYESGWEASSPNGLFYTARAGCEVYQQQGCSTRKVFKISSACREVFLAGCIPKKKPSQFIDRANGSHLWLNYKKTGNRRSSKRAVKHWNYLIFKFVFILRRYFGIANPYPTHYFYSHYLKAGLKYSRSIRKLS